MAEAPKTKEELISVATAFLATGIEAKDVLEFVYSGARVIGFKEGSDFTLSAFREAREQVTAAIEN